MKVHCSLLFLENLFINILDYTQISRLASPWKPLGLIGPMSLVELVELSAQDPEP